MAHQPPYRVPNQQASPNQKGKPIYSRRFLRPQDLEDATLADIEAQIREHWNQFMNQDLPELFSPIQALVK